MAEFRFSLSPPRKGTQAAGLSPRSCLKAKETLTRLQSFGVPVRMSDQDLLTLDPRPEDADVDILSYHDRVSSVLPSDRTKVVVLLPAQSKMDTMSQKFANLEGIVTDLVGKVAELQEGRKREDRVRFQAYQANLVTEFVRKLAKQLKTTIPQGRSKADFDQSRFLAAASSTLKTITAQDFKKKTGLDPSYRETFEDYEKILAGMLLLLCSDHLLH